MKKLALGLLSLFLVVGSISGQEGKKALKKGSKLLKKYASNAIGNAGNLDEGLMLIEKAFESEDVTKKISNYNVLSAAYNAVAEGQINAKVLDPSFVIANPDVVMKAFESITMVLSKAEKKGDKSDAVEALQMAESHMNNIGIFYFQDKDYANAFTYFNKAIEVYEVLKSNNKESRLDNEIERKDHLFYTGAAGYYGKKGMEAAPVLERLAAEGTDKGLVYEALHNIYSAENKEKAVEYLTKGRELFPDDTGLLFAEINFYLAEGKLNILTDKLKAALVKEPDNITIYTTLGNVYDQLNQTERTAGNIAKADEYFGNAMDYYSQAVEKDPKNFDAIYSQGALYYNKAASYTDKINELSNDFSAAGTKKYDALKAEMDNFFTLALPYFEKADGMNDTDLNTLIALKEIYARKDMLDQVSKLKTRIEAISK
ncbi:MAG: tetratricopeptide repeat protein [Saprospiraceae bacterium]